MLVFLNGQFLPEERAVVPVFDRGFLYGDGLFETLRVVNGRPFRWDAHWQRLEQGARFLGISLPFDSGAMRDYACQLIARNELTDALLRIALSRGVGPRGYSPKGAEHPTIIMSLHAAPSLQPTHPPAWRLVTSSFRLPPDERLARFKTCNKLPQILARAEADAAGADEALLLDLSGHVVEGSSSNLFWFDATGLCTPPLTAGILPGVTRAVVMELAQSLGLAVSERVLLPAQLSSASGVFLSVTSSGIVEAISLDGKSLSSSPRVKELHRAYVQLLVGTKS
jgi:branched-chain amino acid aminotransferase